MQRSRFAPFNIIEKKLLEYWEHWVVDIEKDELDANVCTSSTWSLAIVGEIQCWGMC